MFFDDILIYSSSWTEHLQNLRAVLNIPRQLATVKHSQCAFAMTWVAYLGQIIYVAGVTMDGVKVAAWPEPSACTVSSASQAITGD